MTAIAPIADATAGEVEPVPSVLVVDDHPANLLAVEAILAPLRCHTVTASSGPAALKQLLSRRFALILLDVQMPGMDGFETAAEIKAHPRTSAVPIVFLTAYSRESPHLFRGYAVGAADYLLKPIEPELLRAKVAVFLELYLKEWKIAAQAREIHRHELRALQKRSDERFQDLADLMPLPMWRVLADGGVLTSNRAWREYSGLPADRMNNLLVDGVIEADDLVSFGERWAAHIASRQASFDLQARLRAADGSYRWHLFRVVAERSDRGVMQTWIVVATDNDTQKREQELAASANRMKDEFLATVSHELRTPLSAIIGWSRMLREGFLDADHSRRAIEAIERNAHAQTDLVNDILDVSRIVSGKLRLNLESLDLADVIRDALETVTPSAEAKGVRLVADLDRWVPEPMGGDRARLQQVVLNLLTNAVKFTPPGGLVSLSLSRLDGTAEIRVTDTGKGIREDFLPHVFERFQQAEGAATTSHSGLGLGLAIVRHLVELHGGVIRAESEGLGHGSSFSVSLPPRRSPPQELGGGLGPLEESPPPSIRRLDGIRVLVVAADASEADALRVLLERSGAQVDLAADAASAVERMQDAMPRLVINALGPASDADRYKVMRRLRDLPAGEGGHVPAIAILTTAGTEDRLRALDAGFQMHLARPVDAVELIVLVANMAGSGRETGRRTV